MLKTRLCFFVLFAGLFALSACQQTPPSPTPANDVEILMTATPSPNINTPVPTAIPDISTPTPTQEIPEPSAGFDWIRPVDNADISGMNLVWENQNIQIAPDDDAKISLYVAAETSEDGRLMFDDGQDWALLLETEHGVYPLFERKYVQLGEVSCAVFNDFGHEGEPLHILVTVSQSAGHLIYDCVFDFDENAFKIIPVYNMDNINFITKSNME